ncbi:MAG: TonB-dependent receptor [Pseudomonas sp.]
MKTSKLRDAIVFALAISTTSLLAAGSASAQETGTTSNSDVTSLDAISVTGSRIKSKTMTASSPVAEINAEEFKQTGATKVEDLVNQYPQLEMTSDNFENNGSTGYATMDLRGLGAQRTLTLVNGRRLPSGSSLSTDVSIIPTFMVKRVDVLTGGASAVYGSDAVAGVVNFVLDDEFEGVVANVGYSAYQHDNDNSYVQGLADARGFSYPTGNSGFDGISKNIDLGIGGKFGEAGHVMAWATWRKNDGLTQGQRDYSSCTVSSGACGGSATSDPANFYVFSDDYSGWANTNGSSYSTGRNLYNYAPENYYQRPDTRFTGGAQVNYEVNEHFKPYLETMFLNRKSSTQLAPSGAFGTSVTVNCADSYIGSLCSDLGITTTDDFDVYVYKRNVEGGVRSTQTETNTYRIVAGATGAINDYWSYDASFLYGRNHYVSIGHGDLLTSEITDALTTYCDSSYTGTGLCYDVWHDNVSTEAANAVAGTSLMDITTEMKVFNAYVSGSLDAGLPWANGEGIALVGGYEWRTENYARWTDSNTASGNFTGAGGATTALSGGYNVSELFMEAGVPIITDAGLLKRLDASLGYRYSDYSTSGGVNTYKIGLSAQLSDRLLLRTGWNRAIRAPNLAELYGASTVGLWSGTDPCAGSSPSLTYEQCARTGVTADQYGNITENTADQYNSTNGGNADLKPEKATTFTIGFAVNPIENLNLSLDYYTIKVEDAISTLGEANILSTCATTGAADICSLIHRNSNGSLWMSDDGYIDNDYGNFGIYKFNGLDLNASYGWGAGPGRFTTSFVGTYTLKKELTPMPGLTYDCAGTLTSSCTTISPKWRHISSLRYAWDRYTVGLRWRYIGKSNYSSDYQGEFGGELNAYNYLDLSGSVSLGSSLEWTIGVNNIADKEPPLVPSDFTVNGNSPAGYDQAGRYIFTSLGFRF